MPPRFFTGDALYQDGMAPMARERLRRRHRYWQPYRRAGRRLARLQLTPRLCAAVGRAQHPLTNPWLFEAACPDLSIGTAGRASASAAVAEAVVQACAAQSRCSHVLNGRFKGWLHHPPLRRSWDGVHAVQLEMCQKPVHGNQPRSLRRSTGASDSAVVKEMVLGL